MVRYILRQGLDYAQLDGNSQKKLKIKFMSYDLGYSNVLTDLRNNKFVDGSVVTIPSGYYNVSSFVAEFNSKATNFEIVNAGTEYYIKCKTAGSLTLSENMGVMLGLGFDYTKTFVLNEQVKIDISIDFGATHIQFADIMLPLERGKKIYYFGDEGIEFVVRDSVKFIVEYPLLQRVRSIVAENTSYVTLK